MRVACVALGAAAASATAPPNCSAAVRLGCGAGGASKADCPASCCWDDYNNWCYDVAAPDLPDPSAQFAANYTQRLLFHGVEKRATWMAVKLDWPNRRFWVQQPLLPLPCRPPPAPCPPSHRHGVLTQCNNGSVTWTVSENGTCRYVETGPPQRATMPFSTAMIDVKATHNGTAVVDGIHTQVWHVDRTKFQRMYWYVAHVAGSAAPVIVRSDSLQNHNKTTDFPYDGRRDFGFASDTFAAGPPDPSAFVMPHGCAPATDPAPPPLADLQSPQWW